jgi:5-hydroxyisourate hydrolase-like protein (transthyretin family)
MLAGAAFAGLQVQQPPQTAPAPAGVIVGQVVDAGSGKPAANVNVTLVPGASAGLQRAPTDAVRLPTVPMRALTNAEGRFIFRPLSKGAYSVSATASGYMFGSYGQSRPGGPSHEAELDDNAATETITIRMWKYAAISGTVLDEKAEPAVGVTVRALQQQMTAGRRRLVQGAGTQTDDRGMYRLSSLVPGDYVVVVPFSVTNVPTTTVDGYQQSMGSTSPWDITPELRALGAPFTGGVRIGDQQIQVSNGRSSGLNLASEVNGRFLSYQTAFYPSDASLSQATAITLRSGEERSSADLQLRLVPTFRVTGYARTSFGPARFVNVRLVPADLGEFAGDIGLEAATTGADSEGRFMFLAVPSGPYLVKVQTTPAVRDWDGTPIDPEPTLWASQPLTVGDRDPLEVNVLVRQGSGISGRFEFASTSTPRPPAERISTLSVIVLSNERGGSPFNISPAGANADGQFATPRYAPGRYTLLVNSPGPPWTIQSAAVGGREIPLDGLDLGPDDMKDLVITFADQSTELTGAVRDDAGGVSGAAVCVFPFDYQTWIASGMSSRRSRTAALSKSNGFTIRDLAPGDYVVLAVPADLAVDLQDPKWIARLAPLGTRISIKTGEKKRQDLTVSRIR